jgi:hypothetical protein
MLIRQINNMQGRVDLKFRLQGDRDAGTLYFTSIRPKQEGAWRIGELYPHDLREASEVISPIQGHLRFWRDSAARGQGLSYAGLECHDMMYMMMLRIPMLIAIKLP